jgi:hypothetical protein
VTTSIVNLTIHVHIALVFSYVLSMIDINITWNTKTTNDFINLWVIGAIPTEFKVSLRSDSRLKKHPLTYLQKKFT